MRFPPPRSLAAAVLLHAAAFSAGAFSPPLRCPPSRSPQSAVLRRRELSAADFHVRLRRPQQGQRLRAFVPHWRCFAAPL